MNACPRESHLSCEGWTDPATCTVSFVTRWISLGEGAGARAAPKLSSQLIVASINSEISFHFCNNCRIFREGVKGATAIPNGLFGRNLAFGLISASGQNLAFGRTTAFGLINDLQRTEMFYSTNKFQLVVNSIVILNYEGARAVPITVSEGANAVPVIFHDRSAKFIVASNSEGEMRKAESYFFRINSQLSLIGLTGLGQLRPDPVRAPVVLALAGATAPHTHCPLHAPAKRPYH